MKQLKMRRIINLICVSFLLFFGNLTVQAQGLTVADDRPEIIAKKQVSKITEELDLNGNQQRALFRAYVKKEVGYKKHITGKKPTDAEVIQQKKILDQDLEKAVKNELDSSQYEKWVKKFKTP